MNKNNQKCAVISLVGSSNVGKSTLVNSLVGSKVSIVTPKVQTTRKSIKGVYVKDNTQLVFVDTPGIFKPKKKLEKLIVNEAWEGLKQSEIIALVIDAKKGICNNSLSIIKSLANQKGTKILIINKIDLVNKDKLLPLVEELNSLCSFSDILFISALKNDGLDELRSFFINIADNNPWIFEEDEITDAPLRFFAAEITREKLYFNLQQELPYSLAVQTEKWEDLDNGDVKIHQVIFVEKKNQKSIILGKGGNVIKKISTSARRELEKILGVKVHLFLFVKVKDRWVDDDIL